MRQFITCSFAFFILGGALLVLSHYFGVPVMSQTHEVHPHEAELKHPDGSWKYTNALEKETSPYLLQHAHNPVDWYAWGPEAFERARRTGKPIFLSIGYSTCYWCHVMERECFENPTIARQMNEQFVCIKVDREERPDVDDIYMAATVMMNRGQGGWPMSVFLTPPGAHGDDDPGLRPFFAATYIPPVAQYGRQGFPQIMQALSDAWKDRREEVLAAGEQVVGMAAEYLAHRDEGGRLGIESVQKAAMEMLGSYDHRHGGFGKAPKFPTPNHSLFLLATYRNNKNDDLFDALAYTLERMARGGMYDQIGGGFHRYSVDAKWLVPHFEKMLYDNGQLVELYLNAQATRPDNKDPQLYERVVRETCDYVLREMTDATGAFWSAQDAEVDAREGGNYVWVSGQIREAVPDSTLAELALMLYGVDQGTNFQDPHAPDEPPTNVIHLPVRLDELAEQRGVSLAQIVQQRDQINRLLYDVRMQRNQPATDDKVIVSWNGLMIGGLAMAGRDLNESTYLAAAARAARTILEKMRDDDGGLYRTMRDGRMKIEGFLEDYAFFVHGLIELHRSDQDRAWLDAAEQLVELAGRRFGAPAGGYYDTQANQPDLIVRTRTTSDSAIPSGNSQMLHNLLDLHELTGKEAYLESALAGLGSFAGALARQGQNMAHMQHVLLRALQLAPLRVAALNKSKPKEVPDGDALAYAVEPDQIDLDAGDAKVRITLRIEPPYHINANDPGVSGPIPTSLELKNAGMVTMTVDYPPGHPLTAAYADEPINIYEGTVVLEATIRPGRERPDQSSPSPTLLLHYQACTDTQCLLPREVELPVTFGRGD